MIQDEVYACRVVSISDVKRSMIVRVEMEWKEDENEAEKEAEKEAED